MKSRTELVLVSGFIAAAGLAGCGPEDAVTPIGPAPAAAEEQPAAGVNCPMRGPLLAPVMPAQIAPPPDAQLFMRTHAEGAQIYTCQAPAAGGAPSWVFKAPEANLYDDRCVFVGTHFGGPTWKITKDGSAVVGKKMAEAPANVAGSIPWLLLSTSTTTGDGLFGGVTFISRIDTVGGTAPTAGCDAANLGQELKVPYTATYLYYKKAVAPASAPYGGYN